MWNYPKSPLHQAAIDNRKLDRERETATALTEYEIDRIATLAKTQRLRAERLARIDAEPKKPTKI